MKFIIYDREVLENEMTLRYFLFCVDKYRRKQRLKFVIYDCMSWQQANKYVYHYRD